MMFLVTLLLVPLVSQGLSPTSKFCVVGCGSYGRGMGWFHASQLARGECPSGELTGVVEPWFLGKGKDSPGGEAFDAQVVQAWGDTVVFEEAITPAVWPAAEKTEHCPKIALIAGRTVDNPKLFRQALDAGATHIMLEKPGAPTVEELEAMAAEAEERKVPVWMGFIKQISEYVAKALEYRDECVTFKSYNNYDESALGECFERNAEGMLKNMMIHELALAVDFFDVKVSTLADVIVNDLDVRTLNGRRDVVKADVTLVHVNGDSVTLYADRCAGVDGCEAVVHSAADGQKIAAFSMVDEARALQVDQDRLDHPDWLGYLLTQAPEYRRLKEICASFALQMDASSPPNVATIQTAIDSLKLAEHLTDRLLALSDDDDDDRREVEKVQKVKAAAPAPR